MNAWPRELDRPARQDLLKLPERDVRPPERDRSDDRREQRRDLDPQGIGPAERVAVLDPRDIATAPPPTPLNSATICGIAVMCTFRAAGRPTAVPITSRSAISHGALDPNSTCGVSSVATIAIAIPTAAIFLPRTARARPGQPAHPVDEHRERDDVARVDEVR